jgi:hypothetical protein
MRIMVFMNCHRLKRTPGADRCNIETLPPRLRILRRYHWTLCVLAWGCIAASAQATMTTIKFQPNSADINDLDHPLINTRRIDGISPGDFAFSGPALSVGNVPAWDANPNVRRLPVLNAAIDPGIDNLSSSTLVLNINDTFGNIRYRSDSKWPTKAGSAETFLANSTFTTKDYAFDVAASHRQTPAAHMASGSGIGLGLDAGRHFFNDGIKFKMTMTPVPEIEAIYPIISLCAAIAFTRILRRRRTAQLNAGAGVER